MNKIKYYKADNLFKNTYENLRSKFFHFKVDPFSGEASCAGKQTGGQKSCPIVNQEYQVIPFRLPPVL